MPQILETRHPRILFESHQGVLAAALRENGMDLEDAEAAGNTCVLRGSHLLVPEEQHLVLVARSGVNQGLIFRHLGNKDQLVGAVLDHVAQELAAAREAGVDASTMEAMIERQWKVLARTVLDGFDPGQLQRRFPSVSALVDRYRDCHASEADTRIAVAHSVALGLGWRLFSPFLRAAAGLEDIPEEELRRAAQMQSIRILGDADDPQ